LRFLSRANRFSRTPAALAAYLGSTRGTVSQTLLALEAKGLIEKQASAGDMRSVTLSLTRAAIAILARDPALDLARAIDQTGASFRLAEGLEAGLRASLAQPGGRAFGACKSCHHFRKDVRSGANPHHCALLDEPLNEAASALICIEQVPVPVGA
jgi:DNA-binding MarR family transcriptional regulator